jgi:hypothetical protein
MKQFNWKFTRCRLKTDFFQQDWRALNMKLFIIRNSRNHTTSTWRGKWYRSVTTCVSVHTNELIFKVYKSQHMFLLPWRNMYCISDPRGCTVRGFGRSSTGLAKSSFAQGKNSRLRRPVTAESCPWTETLRVLPPLLPGLWKPLQHSWATPLERA